ncbi:unnamed protein product [Mycena citricolor]|uniref:trans-L-3-hydroxyproline dehydratase n=1 Tax=Mycena citricolor TaxID=2018698 RepID=A0AAD2H5D5_9AGAR|nr:unnamed protein product [Mycena citricolor]
MDIFETLSARNDATRTIKVVDMHTSGEPTRIVVGGYPELQGTTLLEKRRCAKDRHDGIRQRLMREPRGHAEMYGAILVPETEYTQSGEADIGVLFCHNEGYSTMCGHATIALGRFLVDTHDQSIFPRRASLKYDPSTGLTALRLHAPCGVVHVNLPRCAQLRHRPDLDVEIPPSLRWPRLCEAQRTSVRVDVSYGGAFYALVSAAELGFAEGLSGRAGATMADFDAATAALKTVLGPRKELFVHPTERDLEFLYGVMVVERTAQGEAGLCFFADQQVDRSPCGSCVMARVALAFEKGDLKLGQARDYESIVSLSVDGTGFRGTAVEKTEAGLIVQVQGKAFYSGASTFVVEDEDAMPSGFIVSL